MLLKNWLKMLKKYILKSVYSILIFQIVLGSVLGYTFIYQNKENQMLKQNIFQIQNTL